MPRTSRAVLAVSDAGGPSGAVELKLTTPATGDINHLVAVLRRGQHGGCEPVKVHRLIGVQTRLHLNHMGLIVDLEHGSIGQSVCRIQAGDGQAILRLRDMTQLELGHQPFAIGVAHDHAGLAGEAARRFWTERQIGIGIKHAAGHVQLRHVRDRNQILICGQGRTPIDHCGTAPARACNRQCLTGVVQSPNLHVTSQLPA